MPTYFVKKVVWPLFAIYFGGDTSSFHGSDLVKYSTINQRKCAFDNIEDLENYLRRYMHWILTHMDS
jgi:hypothetical protein